MVKPQQESESNGNLRGRHGKNKQKHDLAVRLTPTRSRSNECESRRVEHYLNRHQRENHVAPHQQSGQSQSEQDCRQKQRVAYQIRVHR